MGAVHKASTFKIRLAAGFPDCTRFPRFSSCPCRKPNPVGQLRPNRAMLRSYVRSLQPGLVGAGRIVPVAGLAGSEIPIPRHQLNIQRRQSPKRLNFSTLDRLIFAGLYRCSRGSGDFEA
jgi:hypothetical protein